VYVRILSPEVSART